MNIEQSDYGQGIGAAPEAYFAGQSMERVRRGTAQSPVFATGKNGPWIIHEYDSFCLKSPYIDVTTLNMNLLTNSTLCVIL